MSNTLPIRAVLAGLFAFLVNTTSAAAQTIAGSAIVNVATLRYSVGETANQVQSNADVVTVSERLDVMLADVSAGGVAAAMLTNTGSGSEPFAIMATGVDGRSVRIAIDADDDGVYDPAHDPAPVDGRTAALPPGGHLRLFILDAPGAKVTATAVTGSGAPGTVFPGRGDGGSDAVVGKTGATASVVLGSGVATAPTLSKSQSVRSPDGGALPVRGATVTYTLAANFPAAANAVVIDDSVPTGARYVAGSMRLDGTVLSDAADGDPGGFDGAAIHVVIGDAPAGAIHVVTFQTSLE